AQKCLSVTCTHQMVVSLHRLTLADACVLVLADRLLPLVSPAFRPSPLSPGAIAFKKFSEPAPGWEYSMASQDHRSCQLSSAVLLAGQFQVVGTGRQLFSYLAAHCRFRRPLPFTKRHETVFRRQRNLPETNGLYKGGQRWK